MSKVQLYDTTLRDGMQGQGMSLSAAEKIRVVEALDRLGVHFIEAGFPDSNPKDLELFELLAAVPLEQATIAAFGMTRRRDREAAEDPGLRRPGRLLRAGGDAGRQDLGAAPRRRSRRVSRDENLAMIADSVRFCAAAGKRVVYDPEHFFDGWRDDPGYAIACLRGGGRGRRRERQPLRHERLQPPARDRGGDRGRRRRRSPTSAATVGIHAHNDAECGVANSIAAVRAGATLVQGTMNGYGERTGNANLVSILPALQLKLGLRGASRRERLRTLTETAHLVDEICNLAPDPSPALRRPQRLRPQGRHARRRGRGRRPDVRAHGSRGGRQRPRDPDLGAGRSRVGHRPGRPVAGIELDDDGRPRDRSRRSRSASTRATPTRPPTPPSSC